MEKSEPLHKHIVGLSGLAVGIALTLVEAGHIKVPELRRMLTLMYGYIAVTESPEAARPIRHADVLLQAFESSGRDVQSHVALFLGLFFREHPEKRAALLSWLSYATTEEIGDEVRELLRSLADTKPRPSGAPEDAV